MISSPRPSRLRRTLPALAWHATAQILCFLILCWAYRLWLANLDIPLISISGDGVFNGVFVKAIRDTGWWLSNPHLGAPFQLDFYDFPVLDPFQMLTIKFILLFTTKWALALNLYFLLTFHFVVVVALILLRQLKIPYIPAIFCSLLYAFQPYHLERSIYHLMFSGYCFAPVAVLIAVWIIQYGPRLLSRPDSLPLSASPTIAAPPSRIALALAAFAVALSGIYYGFFGLTLIAGAGLISAARHRSWRTLFTSAALCVVIAALLLLTFAPNLMYWIHNGFNAAPSAYRLASHAEVYGLKIVQMLLPVRAHRLAFLADLRDKYDATAPLVNENMFANLGAVGAIGFVALTLGVFYRPKDKSTLSRFSCLALLNLIAVLFATIGGFGSLLNYLVANPVRCYNRISIIIAFITLAAVGLGLKWISNKLAGKPLWRAFFYLALAALLPLALLDQVSPIFAPDHAALQAEYNADGERTFIQEIESSLPPDAMLYQFPARCYPEVAIPIEHMPPYAHWRAYLYADKLRFSGGAMDGRYAAVWQKNVALLPMPQRLDKLATVGFAGLWVDQTAYADHGVALRTQIQSLLNVSPKISADQRFAFFPLSALQAKLQSAMSPEQWRAAQATALQYPLAVYFGDGCYTGELYPDGHTLRWCQRNSSIIFENRTKQEIKVRIHITFALWYPTFYQIQIRGLISENLRCNSTPLPWDRTVTLPPGKHRLTLYTDAPRLHIPDADRELFLEVLNFNATPVE